MSYSAGRGESRYCIACHGLPWFPLPFPRPCVMPYLLSSILFGKYDRSCVRAASDGELATSSPRSPSSLFCEHSIDSVGHILPWGPYSFLWANFLSVYIDSLFLWTNSWKSTSKERTCATALAWTSWNLSRPFKIHRAFPLHRGYTSGTRNCWPCKFKNIG